MRPVWRQRSWVRAPCSSSCSGRRAVRSLLVPTTALCAAVLATACGSDAGGTLRDAGASVSGRRALALLADRRLIKVTFGRRRPDAVLPLGDRRPLAGAVGQLIATARDGRGIFVLVPSKPGGRQSVVLVDPDRMTVVRRVLLPAGDAERTLLVGRRTGRVYVVGNRDHDHEISFTVLDPAGRSIRMRAVVDLGPRDWYVFGAALSEDERDLYVSYHGVDATGGDRFTFVDEVARRCPGRLRPDLGCIFAHGTVVAYRGGVIATTGSAETLVESSRRGRVLRTWSTHMARNHIMEFALDERADEAFAIGSCGYGGGLSDIELRTGHTRVHRYPAPLPPAPGAERPGLCGERIALAGRATLLVAKNPIPVPQGLPSRLLRLTRDGRVLDTVATPVEILDVVAIR
jgi:hypothetical protein